MTIVPLPDVMESGLHGVRTRWIRGFMAFQLARRARRARIVMLMVSVLPESGLAGRTPARTPSLTRAASVQR